MYFKKILHYKEKIVDVQSYYEKQTMKIVLNEQIITNNRNSILKDQNYFQYLLKNLINFQDFKTTKMNFSYF